MLEPWSFDLRIIYNILLYDLIWLFWSFGLVNEVPKPLSHADILFLWLNYMQINKTVWFVTGATSNWMKVKEGLNIWYFKEPICLYNCSQNISYFKQQVCNDFAQNNRTTSWIEQSLTPFNNGAPMRIVQYDWYQYCIG